jgi:uncharacterized protein YuzB (UPF0349 family)
MLIKFTCQNCNNTFEKDELEIIYQDQSFRFCGICGGKLSIQNLKEIMMEEIKERVKNNINKWFKEEGADNNLDLIKRNRNYPITQLYINELRERGFKI